MDILASFTCSWLLVAAVRSATAMLARGAPLRTSFALP